MDLESIEASVISQGNEESAPGSFITDTFNLDREGSFPLTGSSALFGVIIAIATIGVPFTVVLTDRSLEGDGALLPTVSEINGSKPSPTFSFPRIGESSSGNSSWE